MPKELMPVKSSAPKTGASLVPLLLPLLVVIALSVFGREPLQKETADRSHGAASREDALWSNNNPALSKSDYSPVMFTPRFMQLWDNVLRAQYRGVIRCSNMLRTVQGPEKDKVRSNYLMCLRAYNELAALAPDGTFTRQNLPRHISETSSQSLLDE